FSAIGHSHSAAALQGCPLSLLLFTLILKPCAQKKRGPGHCRAFDGSEHKSLLYADDILLDQALIGMCTSFFSRFCGYKINWPKSEVLPISNSDGELGNLVKIRQDLNKWKLIPDGIHSRVETIKMMILPQPLFLLQALLLILPETCFNTWNKMIANFIWNNKKHRVQFKILTQHKDEGGLGIPNIQNYYYATQIATIMKWMKGDTEIKWINLENELIFHYSTHHCKDLLCNRIWLLERMWGK
uniref:Reverse transcriptase domain-containing protein n=1 Tax=Sparus aurata TaxID=8175 RepID=A0A671TRN5_SPAAU